MSVCLAAGLMSTLLFVAICVSVSTASAWTETIHKSDHITPQGGHSYHTSSGGSTHIIFPSGRTPVGGHYIT